MSDEERILGTEGRPLLDVIEMALASDLKALTASTIMRGLKGEPKNFIDNK